MGLNLAVLAGDGVGPAVATRALNLLRAVGEKLDHSLNFNDDLLGGVPIDAPGKALGYETLFMIDCRLC